MGSTLRDVSPVGASRFERPFNPPREVRIARSNTTSAAASPTTPISAATNFSKFSRHTAADSVFSNQTMETEATSAPSVASDDAAVSITARSVSKADDHHVTPEDWFARFHSDDDIGITVSDECPDRATLAAVHDIPIYNAENRAMPFGSLYDPSTATHQRQLIIFVRHFYCGACQAYLQALTQSISMREYFSIPIPTSIIVIGCGQADLIPHYKTFTNCPFPMFADPSRQLFKRLGMNVSFNIGRDRPEYMKDISPAAWAGGQVKTIKGSLTDPDGIRKRDVIRGGNPFQIGGEFLFEDGKAVWCHRMKNYRNHAEIKVLRRLLELDEE
ncbi:Putative peroxiredoxin-like 2A/B/C, Thioredoxin-like superfamily [Septoria linicola]|uniref:Peroxiredoxin-like 2A/B/C, Thioredoxin-like superfamily n=1 Tax=Septoria linicola TaxID=215465 RepID=A0A9Q9AZR8_9PEZI|nr:putative peroxiredoxin-like 2A/B/C, Thioredoxin-like superfamily [Septoria linicola]USW58209.1 Putative peroxiredoxin-like 2A/B/C, Thioredoxin-like superfamily [Septoria linicola]